MAFEWLKGFQDGLEERGIGGNDCAVYVDGEQVYRHFSGYQNREDEIPISEDTLYRMFSMTKPITCAAAMQLYEQGRFLLNDPVSDYLPEFKNLTVRTALPDGSVAIRPAQKPMLVQHLFEMTSGIDYDLNGEPMRKLSEETGDRYTTRQVAALQAERPLRFEPGAHWFYGLGHDVIGALIEVISGKTFGEYLQENLFEPLGMTAWFHEPEAERARLCQRYGRDPEGGKDLILASCDNHMQVSPLYESGGAGLVMTVDDYAKFACAMTNRGLSRDGVRILCGRTVDLMRTNRLNRTQLDDLWMTPSRQGYGYGLGVRTLYDAALSGSTSAIGEFGWGGAWGTYVLMDPTNKVTIVYGQQGVDSQSVYIQRRLRAITYAALERKGLI